MVDALGRRDYPVVSGVNLMFATGSWRSIWLPT